MRTEVFISASEYRKKRGSLTSQLAGKSKIIYVPTGNIKLGPRKQKIWIMLTYMYWSSLLTLFEKSASLNLFLSQPPLYCIWGYILKKLRKQPYCCLIMDVYPDAAVEAGILKRKSFLARLSALIVKYALKEANDVVVIGRCMKEHLSKHYKRNTKFIPNWADVNKVFPVSKDKNIMRHNLDLRDRFLILYSGNIGRSHFFDDLLEVARRLRENKNVSFVIIGGGARLGEIQRAKEKHQLVNLMILPFQPVDKLHLSMSLGDVHFISLRSGFDGLVVPSKAYGAMAAGRPIIYQGNENGEIARMIIEENIGTVVPLGDPDGLVNAIMKYYKWQGERAFQLSKSRYGGKLAIKEYVSIIESCLMEGNSLLSS
jgi:glycosyltransferase involved in cell wall biosynthesis